MSSSLSDRAKQRRRILQASVGAPALFTLPSGAALAAASLSCVEKSEAQFPISKPDLIAEAPDTWVRQRLQRYRIKIKTAGGDAEKWVPGVKIKETYFEVNSVDGTAKRLLSNVQTSQEVDDQYYYGIVDYESYIRGNSEYAYPALTRTDLSPVAGASCWNSVLSTANLQSNIIN